MDLLRSLTMVYFVLILKLYTRFSELIRFYPQGEIFS